MHGVTKSLGFRGLEIVFRVEVFQGLGLRA